MRDVKGDDMFTRSTRSISDMREFLGLNANCRHSIATLHI
jgi:hypothetical protein